MEAMDLMDPRQRQRHNIMLAIGYVLVGIALLLVTIILLFVAYGFGLKDGRVIQSGLLFISSAPGSAQIYIDGSQYRSGTNTKIVLPEATYHFVLKRTGYRDWSHIISIAGGAVQSYTYPLLFPNSLTTNTVQSYTTAPALMTESLDHRWLLVARPGSVSSYDEYDLTDLKQAPVVIAIPDTLLTAGAGAQQIEAIGWGDDNTRVLLKHTYDGGSEYVLFNRANPDQSVNLSRSFSLPTANVDVQLVNNHADRYLVFNAADHTLVRGTLGTPALQPYLSGVLSYAATGDNFVLFATPDPLDAAKVDIELNDGSTSYTVRKDKAGSSYLLAAASYSGDMYLATSAVNDNVAFVYKNPMRALTNQLVGVAVPTQIFRITSPTWVAFSASGQFVVFESGTTFVAYDAETDHGYRYQLPDALDAPQAHAAWMDGARIMYVSHGQVVVADYDGANHQVLSSADPRYGLVFDQSYKSLFTLVPAADDKQHELLTSTSLRTPADQ